MGLTVHPLRMKERWVAHSSLLLAWGVFSADVQEDVFRQSAAQWRDLVFYRTASATAILFHPNAAARDQPAAVSCRYRPCQTTC